MLPGYKIHLQLPPNLPVHTMHHLSILVSNHRSGGAIAFSTLLVLAPRPLPDPSDLTAAAAVSLLANLSLGPSINQRSLIRRQPNGRSAGLECNGSASVGLCESSDSSEDDGERGGEAGLRETFSVSDQLASYHVALKQATSDRKTFARFRSLRSYTYVLEGAGAWYAMVCREVMVRQTEWMDRMLPRIAKTSDAVGGPRTVWLPSPGTSFLRETPRSANGFGSKCLVLTSATPQTKAWQFKVRRRRSCTAKWRQTSLQPSGLWMGCGWSRSEVGTEAR